MAILKLIENMKITKRTIYIGFKDRDCKHTEGTHQTALLLLFAFIICDSFVFGLCFVLQYLVLIISLEKRELVT